MADWERFSELERGGSAFDQRHDAAQYLMNVHGAVRLGGPPALLTEVPDEKALVWVTDSPGGQLAYYVWSEPAFRNALNAGDDRLSVWMLMDRKTADQEVPAAAIRRKEHDSDVADAAERAADPDSLLPVGRITRMMLRINGEILLRYASMLRGERRGVRHDDLLTDKGLQRVAAADLQAIGRELERWAASANWVAVLDPESGSRFDGPLPPFPGEPPGSTPGVGEVGSPT